jgi:hypothetical protein
MTADPALGLVLAVQPTARGFGWVLFEGNMVPVDWGVARPKRDLSQWCMRRFQKLFREFEPATLVLERFDKESSQRGDRIRTLAKTMKGFAESHDAVTRMYSREEVGQAVLRNADATRHDIALAAGLRFPILQRELPQKREVWEPEHDRRCLFDAAALGITHYAHRQSRP